MGSVFLVPWTWLEDPPRLSLKGRETSQPQKAESSLPLREGWGGSVRRLKMMGFTTAAMALRHDNISIDDPKLKATDRLALIMGTEGDGLPQSVIDAADYVVKIPMHHGVDSLNVGNAAAIAFWELAKGK